MTIPALPFLTLAPPRNCAQSQQSEIIEESGCDDLTADTRQQFGTRRAHGVAQVGQISRTSWGENATFLHVFKSAGTGSQRVKFLLTVAVRQTIVAKQACVGLGLWHWKHHFAAQAVRRQHGKAAWRHQLGNLMIKVGDF